MFALRAAVPANIEVRAAGASRYASGVPLAAVVDFGRWGFSGPPMALWKHPKQRGGRDEILRSKRK